jgi:hypothetical protein
MNTYNIAIQYVPKDPASNALREPWVHLEQVTPPPLMQFATLQDVYRLWMAAATGKSAQLIRPAGCPMDFYGQLVHIYLGFYVWPSDPELPFTLSTSNGVFGKYLTLHKAREFSEFIDNADSLDLPYYMEDITVVWETPCYDRYGAQIDRPEVTITPTRLTFDPEFFGCIRVYGKAIGFGVVDYITMGKEIKKDETPDEDQGKPYSAYMVYDKNGYHTEKPPAVDLTGTKISNLQCTVTASWTALDGKTTKTSQLQMVIPQCVRDMLEMCPGMYDKFLMICYEMERMKVYFNGCDGDVIYTEVGDGGFSICTKIKLEERPYWVPKEFYESPNL